MSKPVATLVSTYELETIEAYLLDQTPRAYLDEFFDALEIPSDAEATQLQIAVAQILLRRHQAQLPTCHLGRVPYTELKTTEPLTFEPKVVFAIDWAFTAPGCSWPETYHVTRIAGFESYIVTAAQDSAETWGCQEHAIGKFGSDVSVKEGCRRVITKYWKRMSSEWCQASWCAVWKAGLVDKETAYAWAALVWNPEEELDEETSGKE